MDSGQSGILTFHAGERSEGVHCKLGPWSSSRGFSHVVCPLLAVVMAAWRMSQLSQEVRRWLLAERTHENVGKVEQMQ